MATSSSVCLYTAVFDWDFTCGLVAKVKADTAGQATYALANGGAGVPYFSPLEVQYGGSPGNLTDGVWLPAWHTRAGAHLRKE